MTKAEEAKVKKLRERLEDCVALGDYEGAQRLEELIDEIILCSSSLDDEE